MTPRKYQRLYMRRVRKQNPFYGRNETVTGLGQGYEKKSCVAVLMHDKQVYKKAIEEVVIYQNKRLGILMFTDALRNGLK